MKKLLISCMLLFSAFVSNAQSDLYTVTSGEIIFGWADVEQNVNGQVQNISNNLRFTIFLHLGQYVHYDFSNTFGLYTGGAIRNVGFITEDGALDLEKEKHRSYSLGVPLAFKLGSFDKHFYVFGGAEYELMFHYKYKWWEGGTKYKTTEWFSNRTNMFMPSVFAGVQFPKGLNVKFRYYLDDFLNSNYKKGSDPRNDYSRYKKTQMFHVSVCWQFRTKDIWATFEEDGWQAFNAR